MVGSWEIHFSIVARLLRSDREAKDQHFSRARIQRCPPLPTVVEFLRSSREAKPQHLSSLEAVDKHDDGEYGQALAIVEDAIERRADAGDAHVESALWVVACALAGSREWSGCGAA